MSYRPTVAEVDLSAIADNYRLAVELGGRPAVGVVKADAYGHGAVPVARALVAAGAPLLAVALVEEGEELRAAGLAVPILVLGAAYTGAWEVMVRERLTPLVFTPAQVSALAVAARAAGRRAPVHLKLDTGMGRIGVRPEGLPAVIEALRAHPEVELEGVCTHFASADLEPRSVTEAQVQRFGEALGALRAAGLTPRWRHLANSAATLDHAEARLDLTRPGIMLYGYLPFDGSAPVPAAVRESGRRLRPALTWRTAITHVKEVPAGTAISYGGRWLAGRTSRIATLPVGYADGYPRRLSGRPGMGCAEVLVGGRRCEVAGTICMDMMMADVTEVPGVAEGQEVVLVGAQGEERIGADELAACAGTIAYEVLCGVGRRVPRLYR